MYKVLDLFSGAGGFSCGLEMTKKIRTIAALDFNKNALETFKKNHPNAKIFYGDITNKKVKKEVIDFSKKNNINMIVGGPPCQGFSMKGKKLGLKDLRNYLFLEFLEIVENVSPEIFIMENVSSMFSSSNGYFINVIISSFKKLGYFLNYKILNSSNFGVPQTRKRAFIIGSKKLKINFPKTKKNQKITVYDAISDLSYLKSGNIKFERDYKNFAISKYQKNIRNGSKKLYNHSSTNHSKETLYKLSIIPEKGNKFDLPINLRTNQKFKTTWSRLHWNKPSPTIDTRFDTPSNGQNTHPILNRAITPREAARIQSFPDTFIFYGNKSSICKQIGNAVPPLLAKEIGLSIIKQMEQ